MKLLFSFDVAPINMSVSLIDIETKKIIHWELFSIKASTMELSCMKLIQKLTELYEKYKDNELIILHEDQPRCNKKTVQIAGQIQMYFCLKKLENKNVKKIEGIHPRHKITYYVKMPNDEELPIEYFLLRRFAFTEENLLKLLELIKNCTETDFSLSELLEQTQLQEA